MVEAAELDDTDGGRCQHGSAKSCPWPGCRGPSAPGTELRLVGGVAVVRNDRPQSQREKVTAAFFEAFAVETSEELDDTFEGKLAAAFRAIDAYNVSRGWRPPERTQGVTLSLFGALPDGK